MRVLNAAIPSMPSRAEMGEKDMGFRYCNLGDALATKALVCSSACESCSRRTELKMGVECINIKRKLEQRARGSHAADTEHQEDSN